jgi:hypothetical protein
MRQSIHLHLLSLDWPGHKIAKTTKNIKDMYIIFPRPKANGISQKLESKRNLSSYEEFKNYP